MALDLVLASEFGVRGFINDFISWVMFRIEQWLRLAWVEVLDGVIVQRFFWVTRA
jgi:hypothetical protein